MVLNFALLAIPSGADGSLQWKYNSLSERAWHSRSQTGHDRRERQRISQKDIGKRRRAELLQVKGMRNLPIPLVMSCFFLNWILSPDQTNGRLNRLRKNLKKRSAAWNLDWLRKRRTRTTIMWVTYNWNEVYKSRSKRRLSSGRDSLRWRKRRRPCWWWPKKMGRRTDPARRIWSSLSSSVSRCFFLFPSFSISFLFFFYFSLGSASL